MGQRVVCGGSGAISPRPAAAAELEPFCSVALTLAACLSRERGRVPRYPQFPDSASLGPTAPVCGHQPSHGVLEGRGPCSDRSSRESCASLGQTGLCPPLPPLTLMLLTVQAGCLGPPTARILLPMSFRLRVFGERVFLGTACQACPYWAFPAAGAGVLLAPGNSFVLKKGSGRRRW